MHVKNGALHICDGAVVEVTVQLCAAEKQKRQQAGQSIPPPQTIRAQIDTGASRSCVDLGILERDFGLTSVDRENFEELSSGGNVHREIFVVDLSIVIDGYNASWGARRVAKVNLGRYGFKAVIGRDLLAGCVFKYDGTNNSFSLSV